MRILAALLALTFTAPIAHAQVSADFDPPALGSSQVIQRNDLNAEYDAIATSLAAKQASDTELTCLAGTTSAADKVPYYTGAGTCSTTDFTATARSILDDTSIATVWATLTGDELSQDAIGAMIADTSKIDFTYTDATPQLSATIVAGSLGTADLGTDSVSADELNATGVESELEAVLEKADLQGDLTLAGDVDGAHGSNDLDEASVEAELEAVLDINELQGTASDAQISGANESDEVKPTEHACVAMSDLTTALTTGTGKAYYFFPMAVTVTNVYAYVNTVSSSGNPAIDINEGGVSILSTTITIDANEDGSDTAATPPVISDTSIAAHAQIRFDIDTAGTGTLGLIACIVYTRT